MAELVRFPKRDEIVLARVTKVLNYGVFLDLVEYPGVQGFVHISQVASSWVKNIRSVVKENEMRAAQVTHFDVEKKQVDLSFNRVSDAIQKQRIEAYKNAQKNHRLMEMLSKEQKKPFSEVEKLVVQPLMEYYGSLQDAFADIAKDGAKAAVGVSKEWVVPLTDLVQKNIVVPKKIIRGTLSLSTLAPNGVELIRQALLKAKSSAKGADLELFYEGSGKYAVKITSDDFKTAEKVLKAVTETAIDSLKSAGGTAGFERAAA